VILVPVLDLKGGKVVHARSGRRERYRPIESRLFRGSDPQDAAASLINLYPFPALYAADLDRIEGQGTNDAALRAIRAACPAMELWVDGGFASAAEVAAFRTAFGAIPVIGSESLKGDFRAVLKEARPDGILSLDFRGGRFLGPEAALSDPSLWPRRVIVMELERVGSESGPDMEHLAAIAAKAPAGQRVQIFAAGGVRNIADLRRLQAAGIAGALIATALHTGEITQTDLASLAADTGRTSFEA
jgi:phosphoribosylformimino-5-aminoimidazole carboxamide ribotide isomerase